VDSNPVKAGMVARAEDYPWSSYRAKIGLLDANGVVLIRIISLFDKALIPIGALLRWFTLKLKAP